MLWNSRFFFFRKDVEKYKLQLRPLRVKTGQTDVLNLNQLQSRNIKNARSIANHHGTVSGQGMAWVRKKQQPRKFQFEV